MSLKSNSKVGIHENNILDFVQFSKITGHRGPLSDIKFSPNSEQVATASADKSIFLWDISKEKVCAKLHKHTKGINSVAWAHGSNILASGGDDRLVILWDRRTSLAIRTLRKHSHYVSSVTFNPLSNILASGSFDETVQFWDIRGGSVLYQVSAHMDPITSLDFSPDGTVLVSGSYDGLVRMWDSSSELCLLTMIPSSNTPVIGSVRMSPNSSCLVVSDLESTVHILDFRRNVCLRKLSGHLNKKFCSSTCFLNLDYQGSPVQYLSIGDENGNLCTWMTYYSKTEKDLGSTSNEKSKSSSNENRDEEVSSVSSQISGSKKNSFCPYDCSSPQMTKVHDATVISIDSLHTSSSSSSQLTSTASLDGLGKIWRVSSED